MSSGGELDSQQRRDRDGRDAFRRRGTRAGARHGGLRSPTGAGRHHRPRRRDRLGRREQLRPARADQRRDHARDDLGPAVGGEDFTFAVTSSVYGFTSFTAIAALADDYNGGPKSDFLIQNTTGAVVVGEVGSSGKAGYATVAALGPEWKFDGSGDYLGDGKSQFLIENTSGAVDRRPGRLDGQRLHRRSLRWARSGSSWGRAITWAWARTSS